MLSEILNTHLLTVGSTVVTVATLVSLAMIALATIWISWLLQRAAVRVLGLGKITDKGSVGVARRVIHYTVLAVGFGIAVQTLGINLGALFTAGAVFAVAIGFATQNLLENFASGLILLGERTIKPGDILQVEDRTVEVMIMGFRSTVVRTRDEEEMILPNSILVQNTVKNYTLQDSLYRLRVQVGVTYSSDVQQVFDVLRVTARGMSWRLSDREPAVHLTQFGSSSVDFEVSVWIDDPWAVPRRRSELHTAIWWALKEAGVVIAFPQLDLHLDTEVVQALHKPSDD